MNIIPTGLSAFQIKVLLIDDQPIIGEAVRRMLSEQPEITLHYCSDPIQALPMANELRPTVILQDLVMPEIDGLTLVKFFRANPATRDTPLIVLSSKEEPLTKAEAFARGANDYLVKLPDKIELIARIRHHSQGYINLLERNEAYAALARSQQRMAEEIEAAVKFVMSLLPTPTESPIRIDSRYVPCVDLGGDTFGYHWIDDDHLAVYLLDVTGHGLDSALLSVTVMNVLRSKALAGADVRVPGQVLGALNDAFPAENYGEKFFTIWYGVYHRPTQTLSWSGGGHPDALLFAGDQPAGSLPQRLGSDGPMMGMMPWPEFETSQCAVPAGSRLYVYSDGCHEIHSSDGAEWKFDEFVSFIAEPSSSPQSLMDRLLATARRLKGSDQLDDDFSIIEMCFP
ncbi:MAG: SpoIIE family protein phosphatase [Planctomycetia bacterium]|nr:SpoIIE family protein phosphatase [Planctomycetia bacterium]